MVRNQREHKQAQEMHELRQSTAQLREQVERDRIREPALALQDSICQSLESLTALVSKSIDEWDRRGLFVRDRATTRGALDWSSITGDDPCHGKVSLRLPAA